MLVAELAWCGYYSWSGSSTEPSPLSISFFGSYTPCADASFAGHTAFATSSFCPLVSYVLPPHSTHQRSQALPPLIHEIQHHCHRSSSADPEGNAFSA
jgi:hypothetical protein